PYNRVDFNQTGAGAVITTTSGTAGALFSPWATVNSGADWASVNGSSQIAALASAANAFAASGPGPDVTITADSPQASGNLFANSVNFANTSSATLTLDSGANVIASGGILASSAMTAPA